MYHCEKQQPDYLPSSLATVPCHKRPFPGNYKVFCPWKGNIPFPNILQDRECSLQCDPEDLYIVLCTPESVPSFSQERMLQLYSGESHALLKPQSLSSTYCLHKTCDTSTPGSPVRGLERFLSCESLTTHSLNPCIFLSLLSLHGKGSLSSTALPFFSPSIHFHPPHTCHALSLQLWRCLRSISWVFQVI